MDDTSKEQESIENNMSGHLLLKLNMCAEQSNKDSYGPHKIHNTEQCEHGTV